MLSRLSVSLGLICTVGLFSFSGDHYRTVRFNRLNGELNGTPHIIIDKSDYELSVYDDDGWYATYPVVFGEKTGGDKMWQGDRKTPEGEFKIVTKRPDKKWGKMMLIDYPTPVDVARFKERKAKGLIPAGKTIGDGIGIHGTWERDDMAVDYMQNWTNGCISLKRNEMEEIYTMIPIGTRVSIRK
ncbi:L,D-transpeptidase family protein [Flavihumibacter petaseus]|uniref:Peptidase C82 family protein n=1 Tax=Flavihumibacter petaseus NBRC 106054 TaxID=1220578 RepID=A0A0E9N7G9_9BACT|nr:L,D-transpeptidase [Flavihumibacter petaseus]GAO45300.1 peptidase C82 family protein [Flavihumibacter petaseus NBRC 106054]